MIETLFKWLSLQDLIWGLVLLPLLSSIFCATLVMVSKKEESIAIKWISTSVGLIISIVALAFSIIVVYILTGFEGSAPSATTMPLLRWTLGNTTVINLTLAVDEVTLVITTILTASTLLMHLYSIGLIPTKSHLAVYHSLSNLGISFSMLIILSNNVFFASIAWLGLGMVVWLLSGYCSNSARHISKFAILDFVGSMSLILAVALLYTILTRTGADGEILSYAVLHNNLNSFLIEGKTVLILIMLAVLVRLSNIPSISYWELAQPSQAVFSSLLLYGAGAAGAMIMLVRFNFIYVFFPEILRTLTFIGAATIILSSFFSLVEHFAQKSLALVASAHTGLVTLAYGKGLSVEAFFIWASTFPAIYMASLCIENAQVLYHQQPEGLKKHMPVTFWLMLIASASIAGVYPFGGFFSKEGILWEILNRGEWLLYATVLLGVVTMSFAVFRILGKTFFGEYKGNLEIKPTEAGVSQLFSITLLVLPAVLAGWFGASSTFGGKPVLLEWIRRPFVSEIAHATNKQGKELLTGILLVLMIAHAAIMSLIIYSQKRSWPKYVAHRLRILHKLLAKRLYTGKAIACISRQITLPTIIVVAKITDRLILLSLTTASVSFRYLGRTTAVLDTLRSRYVLTSFLIGMIILVLLAML